MKIGHQKGVADNVALKGAMENYRQTPQPATNIGRKQDYHRARGNWTNAMPTPRRSETFLTRRAE